MAHVWDTRDHLKGKPLLLSEFGRSQVPVYPTQSINWLPRDAYYDYVFELLEDIMRRGNTPLQARTSSENNSCPWNADHGIGQKHRHKLYCP